MTTSKTILFIGAGIAQVDAIKRAKEMGYYVLASDGSDTAPGLKVADESRVIDVKNIDENLSWAKKCSIKGVIGIASDIVLPTVHAIKEKLNLPGLSEIPMRVSLDKSQQRKRFADAGLAQPKYTVLSESYDTDMVVRKIGFPCVVKPVDNAGSRGVAICQNIQELQNALQIAYSYSNQKKLLVEEYMDGVELTVEGISVNGDHHILTISDKFKPESNYRVATQLAYPAAISSYQWQEVEDLMKSAYYAAEIDNSPTHSEVILTSEGPKIVEISCRGGGFYVFTRVVEAASCFDIVKAWICLCAGDEVPKINLQRRGVILRFFAAKPGRLRAVYGLEEAKAAYSDNADIGLFIEPGEMIPELKTDGSRTGYIIAQGKDRSEAVSIADKICKMVQFDVE